MLTREDIDDLFDILAAYRKNDPNLWDKGTKAAWLLSLKPYKKADVKEAIGAWFRQSKYWPEPSEIAALCPPLPEENPRGTARRSCPPDSVQDDLARMERYLQKLREEAAAL